MSWELSYGPSSAGKRPISITLRELSGFRTGFTSELTPLAAKCAK